MTLHVRIPSMQATVDAINREMRRLAPEVGADLQPMTEAVAVAVLPFRIGAACTAVFGDGGDAARGAWVYGLVSFSVVQRTREIGVRKAVGAQTPDIVRLIVGGSAGLSVLGLGAGLGLGALGAIALRGFMTGVSPVDPLTLTAVAVLVMGAAIAASALPALRAARVDPIVALRDL